MIVMGNVMQHNKTKGHWLLEMSIEQMWENPCITDDVEPSG